MGNRLSGTVHSIFSHGLALRDRLAAGVPLNLAREHSVLRELFARLAVEEKQEPAETASLEFAPSAQEVSGVRWGLTEDTIRHALTYWIDELIGQHTPQGARWGEQPLEFALFAARRGSEHFWEQARYTEVRGDVEALHVLYWCVLLGFRGSWRDRPEAVQEWAKRVLAVLEKSPPADPPAGDWDFPLPEPAVDTELPYQRVLFGSLMLSSLLVPLGLLLWWRHWPA
jgi:type VI protein secretion system component VasF